MHPSSNRRSLSQSNINEYTEEHMFTFLTKDKWIPNEKAKNCFNCKKKFLPLYRHKHHCRLCGNIFCENCSQKYLTIDELEFPNSFEKKIRVCDYCHQKFKKSKAKKRNEKKKDCFKYFKNSEEVVINMDRRKKNFADFEKPEFFENEVIVAEHKVSEQFNKIYLTLTQRAQIPPSYADQLFDMLKRALNEVHPNTSNSTDWMNITNYIKIKKIPFSDTSMTKYYNGIVCRKTVSDKKMLNIKLNNPQIMIISSIEASNEDLTSFDYLIQNEKKTIKRINEKILKLKPNIILIQKSINRISHDFLKEKGVVLVLKVKSVLLKRIAKLTGTKVIHDVTHLEKIKSSFKLGTCEKFYVSKFFVDNYEADKKTSESDYMFLEGCNSNHGVTITISGPSKETLKNVKKCLNNVLVLFRDLVLEKEIILADKLFNYQLSAIESPHESVNQQGNFNLYLFERMPLNEYLKINSITYTKVNFVYANIDSYADISTSEDALSALKQMLDKKKNSLNELSFPFFSELCGGISYLELEFYSEDDLSIGQYLLLKGFNLSTICEICKKPKFQHTVVYYSNQVYVKVSSEIIKPTSLLVENQVLEETSVVKKKESIKESVSQNNLLQKSTYECLQSSSSVKKVKSFFNNFKEEEMKDDLNISSHIECDGCREVLTRSEKLSKEYLEYSFTRFLMQFFSNSHSIQEDTLHEIERRHRMRITCQHIRKCRIFQINGVNLKITSGPSIFFTLEHLQKKLNSNQSKNKLLKMNESLVCIKREEMKGKLFEILKEIMEMARESFSESEREIQFISDASLRSSFYKEKCKGSLKDQKNKEEERERKVDEDEAHNFGKKRKDEENNIMKIEEKNLSEEEECGKEAEEQKGWKEERRRRQNEGNGRQEDKGVKAEESGKGQTEEENELFFGVLMNNFDRENDFFMQCSMVSERREEYMSSEDEEKKHEKKNKKKDESAGEIKKLNNMNDVSKIKKNGMEYKDFINEKVKCLTDLLELLSQQCSSSYLHLESIRLKFLLKTREILQSLSFFLDSPKSQLKKLKEFLRREEVEEGVEEEEDGIRRVRMSNKFFQEFREVSRGVSISDLMEKKGLGCQKFDFVPIEKGDTLSAIANCLNSEEYMKQVYIKNGFHEIESKFFETKEVLKKNLFEVDFKGNSQSFKFKTYVIPAKKQFKTENKLMESISLDYEEGSSIKKLKQMTDRIKVIVYYAASFEALRLVNNISLSDFIQSLALNSQWKENSGGKSKAKFLKSYDDLYILKQLGKEEFFMFQEYASSYFSYNWNTIFSGRESLLTKIFGLYEVSTGFNSYYYIAMENLFFELESENYEIYDLKGSELNRYIKQMKPTQTLLDTNFKINYNNEPLKLIHTDFEYAMAALENDTNFLSFHNLVDYSLLIIVDLEKKNLRLGIIDYLRIYDWVKQLEHMSKIVINAGTTPTITNPDDYRERFLTAMKKFIMEVRDI